ncbi:MAG TPA: hypothetical protein DEF12_10460, partial [Rhodobacteraceae bacterium]|nr:hypothetical protein [Paracoccaceae bacterium]
VRIPPLPPQTIRSLIQQIYFVVDLRPVGHHQHSQITPIASDLFEDRQNIRALHANRRWSLFI